MGRKLSPLKRNAFTEGNAAPLTRKRNVSSSSHLNSQTRIAEALGLPVSAFRLSESINGSSPEVCNEDDTAKIAMSRDCLDLIRAFTCIPDPVERQRLLKFVRDAADKVCK